MIGMAEIKGQIEDLDLLFEKWNLLYMINKGWNYIARKWLNSLITTKEFRQAENLFRMLPNLYEEGAEWFSNAADVIRAKFARFVWADSGEFGI
jgi:hypothetical protein